MHEKKLRSQFLLMQFVGLNFAVAGEPTCVKVSSLFSSTQSGSWWRHFPQLENFFEFVFARWRDYFLSRRAFLYFWIGVFHDLPFFAAKIKKALEDAGAKVELK